MRAFLGVDGGGTQTRAVLADSYGQILHHRLYGPSNINRVGEPCVRNLLTDLCNEVRPLAEEIYACFGLAGTGSSENRSTINKIFSDVAKFNKTTLSNDAEVALEGAFPAGPGMILIAGTGSIFLGRTRTKQLYRHGGYGGPQGDPGSGFWIGRRAIEAAKRSRQPSTFSDTITASLDLKPSSKADALLSDHQVAALAPALCALAEAGDSIAIEIIDSAASALASLAISGCDSAEGENTQICLLGGILENETLVRRRLLDKLASKLPYLEVREPKLPAVGGATLIAREQMSSNVIQSNFTDNLSNSLRSSLF